jgi:hypothetical protein
MWAAACNRSGLPCSEFGQSTRIDGYLTIREDVPRTVPSSFLSWLWGRTTAKPQLISLVANALFRMAIVDLLLHLMFDPREAPWPLLESIVC